MAALSRSTWRRALVLGGIRSGKSGYAEDLAGTGDDVRYVATARRIPGDDEWNTRIDTHRARRPRTWTTAEVGEHPLSLIDLVTGAADEDTLLVDDIGTWVSSVMEITHGPAEVTGVVELLVGAIRGCPARLVFVSPEVGLSIVPATAEARAFADALGLANHLISGACDRVVLVIAGNAVPVKGGP